MGKPDLSREDKDAVLLPLLERDMAGEDMRDTLETGTALVTTETILTCGALGVTGFPFHVNKGFSNSGNTCVFVLLDVDSAIADECEVEGNCGEG